MAISFIGASNLIATNGGAPGAITVNASTSIGDLLVFYHYGRATGGNETVSISNWNLVYNTVVANNGHVAVYWRIRQSGDTTYTATVTNYTSGASGETILEWIETYRGIDSIYPVYGTDVGVDTWASSLTLGPIFPSATSLENQDWVVVFAGRFENITAQTTLTGDSLTWTARTRNDSTLGSDAGAVTQTGYNNTGSAVAVSEKNVTTTGTTQVGAGTMFFLRDQAFVPSDPFGQMGFFGL
jgi:hypothetical protein